MKECVARIVHVARDLLATIRKVRLRPLKVLPECAFGYLVSDCLNLYERS
jgi:hypothetical protein